LALGSLSAIVAIAAACGAPQEPVRSAVQEPCYDGGVVLPEPPDNAKLPAYTGPMPVLEATHMESDLRAVGLDPANLPPFEQLDRRQLGKVMRTFTRSLGIACVGCHDVNDFSRTSARKRAAKSMWNEFVRKLAMADGKPVYCDSCHQGGVQVLDRRDKAVVASYMDDVFVGMLRRSDGKEHDCGTCHGDPPEFSFLADWKKAPDGAPRPEPKTAAHDEGPPPSTKLVPCERSVVAYDPKSPPPVPGASGAAPVATGSSAPAPSEANAKKQDVIASAGGSTTKPPEATTHARTPWPPRVKPMPAKAESCGGRDNPCPLQLWMRQNMAPALAAKDGRALAVALDKAASLSPDPSWDWSAMAKGAADEARKGNVQEARQVCQLCHRKYKATYRDKHKTRAIK
jgi:hypothetical protein